VAAGDGAGFFCALGEVFLPRFDDFSVLDTLFAFDLGFEEPQQVMGDAHGDGLNALGLNALGLNALGLLAGALGWHNSAPLVLMIRDIALGRTCFVPHLDDKARLLFGIPHLPHLPHRIRIFS